MKPVFACLMILVFSCSDKHLSTQSNNQEVFNEIIQEADSYYDKQLWEEAKSKYGYALSIKPDSAYASDKYQECIQLMENGNQYTPELICLEIVSRADELFENESYSRAQLFYQRAKTLECADSLHINVQMTSIKQIMDAQ